jgi:hypothetical protein
LPVILIDDDAAAVGSGTPFILLAMLSIVMLSFMPLFFAGKIFPSLFLAKN